MNNLQKELQESNLMPIMEIEVIDSNGNDDWIVCDVSITDNKVISKRIGVTTEECNSKYIAKTEIDLDLDFSLDEHLQSLHEAILEDIINGNLYNIK